MMRWADMAPLASAIIALVIFLGIIILAILKRDVPQSLTLAAGAAVSSFFLTGAIRGSEPPKGDK